MKSSKAIINGNLIMRDRIIPNGAVIIRDQQIVACGAEHEVKIPEDCEVYDARGRYVGPGFIDIHCHGGGGFLSHQEPLAMVKAHMKHGTTGILPTIAYTVSPQDTLTGISKILQAMEEEYGSAILGIHMEGPYTNPKYGTNSYRARVPEPEEYMNIVRTAKGRIKVWTFAPELEGIEAFVEDIADGNVVLSAGHTEAEAEQIYRFIPKGLRLACHWGCATGTTPNPSRYAGTKEVGVDEAVLLCDDIYAEVIPDSLGAHVRPLMLRLLYKTKGPDRIIIITDGMEKSGVDEVTNKIKSEVEIQSPGDLSFDQNGDLAGTRLTMDVAVANMMKHTGIGMVEAFKMASLNPARLLGVDGLMGSIEVGKKANLLLISEPFVLESVMFEGEWIY